jgi:hypothetical protein
MIIDVVIGITYVDETLVTFFKNVIGRPLANSYAVIIDIDVL